MTHTQTAMPTIEDMQSEQLGLQNAKTLPVSWVSSQSQLADLVALLPSFNIIALDTEFIKRDTYYPRLALVQVNTGKGIYLVDAPELDLTNFWQALAKVPLMVWHACGEDLGIFYLLSDVPVLNNVFDTQIGLAFLTGQLQLGYQKALEDLLQIEVDKGHSQSDWLARPLTAEQEHYAVDDVRYLLPLYQKIFNDLTQQGLYEVAMADCQMYASDLYNVQQVSDDEQYLSVSDFRYSGKQLAFLRELMAWREKIAKATNQPRTFILRKQGIRELVELMPKSKKQLKQQTSVHRKIIETYGDEILRIVEQSAALDPSTYPALIIPPYRSKDKTVKKAVDASIKRFSEQSGVPTNVIMRKKWLSDLYEMVALDKTESYLPQGLLGWRFEWLKNDLLPLLKKHRADLREGMGLK